ncbi:MAG: ATP-dependent Clp protease adaptor ClpS [Planctomycetes bacterium]|nr:ATP-dependent Clp protease adaptor ClpS [Planctomycetota bacterium]
MFRLMQTQDTPVLEPETGVQTKLRYSPRWRIIGHNDDVTSVEFVVILLMKVFHKSERRASELTLEVHESGSATFYLGTKEACELKVDQVAMMNLEYSENLKVSMEPIEDEA